MTEPIHRVGVIGAGVMGSGIAAHFANAGLRVLLVDIVPPNLSAAEKDKRAARNRFAQSGLEKALQIKPAAFFHKSRAQLVAIGNLEDDFAKLGECDLVIEAIVERLDVKQKLFERMERELPGTRIVASNTSGLRIVDMLAGRGDAFRKNFLVMHFFNPVRYMKLLELVAGPDTAPSVIERVTKFGREALGKGIVLGKDTPNFVGNRIGCYSLMVGVHQMLQDKLAPEDVDAITGLPMGHPKSASFRTADMVGLDTFIHVSDNCYASLTNDEEREVFKIPDYMREMGDKKLLGNKTKAGFYRKGKEDVDTYDPYIRDYRPKGGSDAVRSVCKNISRIEDPAERIRKLVADEGPAGRYAWAVLSRSLAYSARRIGEITDSVEAVDSAMKWGYNWELGPFETWDALGFKATTERMKKSGLALPDSIEKMMKSGATAFYQGNRVFNLVRGDYEQRSIDKREATLTILRGGKSAVLSNGGAEAWDIGDGVLGITFKTKANSIDNDVIAILNDGVARAERDFNAVLIYNQGEFFCVGANLMAIVMAAGAQQWDSIRGTVKAFQATVQRLKYSSIPVVAAPYGMTLGGGLEICLGCDAVQAAAETYSGLVEVGVGLIPGGAGNMNLLYRALASVPEGVDMNVDAYVTQVFKNVAMAQVATSADEAKHFGYFRGSDGVSFDRARHLTEAKALAIGLANRGYHPPPPRAFRLPGESGIATLHMMIDTLVAGGFATEHDKTIARKLAVVLCGGASGATREVTEEELLDIEADVFVSLCGEAKSQERMQYMLMNNKPLRN